jgi:hypothetical protein
MKLLAVFISTLFTAGQAYAQKHISTVEIENQIILTAIIETFDSTKHTYDTCVTGLGWKAICLIDNEIWFGNDSGMELPRNKLINLTIKIDEREILLDVTGMYNPNWDNEIRKDQFAIKKAELGYYLYAYFSDGAGTYTVHWKIIKGKSIRLKISKDDCDFFLADK